MPRNPRFQEHVEIGEPWAVRASQRSKKPLEQGYTLGAKSRYSASNLEKVVEVDGQEVHFAINHGFRYFVFKVPETFRTTWFDRQYSWAVAEVESGAWFASGPSRSAVLEMAGKTLARWDRKRFTEQVEYARREAAKLRPVRPHLDDDESEVLRHVTSRPTHIEDIRDRTGLPIQTVASALTMMELKGLVRQVGGMNFVRGGTLS